MNRSAHVFSALCRSILPAGLALCLLLTGCTGAAGSSSSAPPASASSAAASAYRAAPKLSSSTPGLLRQALVMAHPSPFTLRTQEDFDAAVDALDAQWDTLKDDPFTAYYALRELAASIGDAHTTVLPPTDMEQQPFLPFQLCSYGGHWLIVQAHTLYARLVGQELLAVNGYTVPELREKLLPIISHESAQWADQQALTTALLLPALRYVGVTDRLDAATVTVRDLATGESSTLEVQAITDSRDYSADTVVSCSGLAPTMVQHAANYLAFPLEDGSLYIQYNVCREDPALSMQDFASSLAEQFPAGGPAKVIVDLRYNGGGDSTVIQPLLDTLESLIRQGSRVYCLIGAGTFSSGVMAAADIQELGACMVGEATGGYLRTFGDVRTYPLNGGYALSCSTKNFAQWGGFYGSVEPDFPLTQTLEDFAAGQDTLVAFVLNDG